MLLPRIAVTMGDVAGIGPEVIVRAWRDARLMESCRPIVVGHPEVLARAADLIGTGLQVECVDEIDDYDCRPDVICCWNPAGDEVRDVEPGHNDKRAGHAAYTYVVAAAQAALDRRIDAIATAPLSKGALNLAGYSFPGHTEILANLCSVDEYAMMLYLAGSANVWSRKGLGVVHVTLHTSVRSVPRLLTEDNIFEKIGLIHHFMQEVEESSPHIGVCALNPHAGEDGLFGDEDTDIILPAVQRAVESGFSVQGPFPADTLFRRAATGEFDAVVAMYHDQGHIALKLIGLNRAVNVTLGLPIVRTSPSHGTAFDIAWKGKASGEGMIESIRVASRLAARQTV